MKKSNLKLNPLTGAHDIKGLSVVVVILFIVFLLASGVISLVFLALFVVVILFISMRLYGRLSEPWKRVHFPIMHIYAALTGFKSGLKDIKVKGEPQEFTDEDITKVFKGMLQMVYIDYTEKDAEDLIQRANTKVREFTNRKDLQQVLRKNLKDNSEQNVVKSLEKIKKKFQEKIPSLQFIIAEIIEQEYGIKERRRYISALLSGAAV